INATLNPSMGVTTTQKAMVRLDATLNKYPALAERVEFELGIQKSADWLVFLTSHDVDAFIARVKRIIAKVGRELLDDKVLVQIRKAEQSVHKKLESNQLFLEAQADGVSPPQGAASQETASRSWNRELKRIYTVEAIQGSKPDEEPTKQSSMTATFQYGGAMKSWTGFGRKAIAMQLASDRGDIRKVEMKDKSARFVENEHSKSRDKSKPKAFPKSVAHYEKQDKFKDARRINDLSEGYKNLVRTEATSMVAGNSEMQKQITSRLAGMYADHIWELQAGGPDSYKNLRMLDISTNSATAGQLSGQAESLSDGVAYKIQVVWPEKMK
ncbi:hypothetical protein ABZZ80_36790, partial [Streptomyces sp. NPDC006356]